MGGKLVRDEAGREVLIPPRVERIVALSPSLVEILFAIGLGNKVVGATRWADYPPAARALPKVGAYVSPSIERILALAPDLVLANKEGNPRWVVEQLTRAGVSVYVTCPDDPLRLPGSIRRLGGLLGAARGAEAVAEALERAFREVAARVKNLPRVGTFMVVGNRPIVCAGPGSYSGRLLAMAGARNLAPRGAGPWPRVELEYVLKARPQLIIVSTMTRGARLKELVGFWKHLPGLKGTRVEWIPSDLVDRPGPRLAKGVRLLARKIHPEAFRERQR